MMKVCVIRLWLPAVLLAGLLLGACGSELRAQPASSTGQASLSTERKAQLAQAAKLANAGKFSAAMVIYRQAFGTHPPPGDLALAYYETEAATDGGRAQAAEGLRTLAEKSPADPRYQISLGRVLTYDPSTREQGRTYLAKFPDYPQAAQALRQSLLWDAANPAVAPQIRAYLAAHPDPQLAAVYQLTHPEAGKVDAGARQDKVSRVATQSGSSASMPIVVTPASSRVVIPAAQPAASQSASASPVVPPAKIVVSSQVSATTLPPSVGTSAVEPVIRASQTKAALQVATPLSPNAEAHPVATAAPTVSGSVPAFVSARPASALPETDESSGRSHAAAEVAAYQALNANRIDEAESRFKTILTAEPHNEKALAGMGYVRMQQGDFPGAILYLKEAKQIDAAGAIVDKTLLVALDTAHFWSVMGEGRRALAANDLTTAENCYRDALSVRPDNAEALEGLGSTLLKAQQPSPAIALYEHATAVEPGSIDGWRGLFLAQFRNNQATAALATFQRMPEMVRAQLRGSASFLEPLASAYAAVGRTNEAQTTFENALKLPFAANENALKFEIQMELASVLSSANHLDQAVALYKQVVAEDAGNTAAWESLARLEVVMGHDQDAFETVEHMPPATYTTAMHAPDFEITVASIYERRKQLDLAQNLLQKAVTDETNAGQKPSSAIEMQLANIYVERGNPQLAYPVYQQVLRETPERADAWAGLLAALHLTGHDKEAIAQLALIPAAARRQLETSPEYRQTMAAVYAAVGQTQVAAQMPQPSHQNDAAQRIAPVADAEVQKAWLLYNGVDDAGLYAQLMRLGGRSDLTVDQRRAVQTIWMNWAARRADLASAAGNPRRAVQILNAAARAFPDNPAAIKLLAAAYMQAGEPHQAVLIYKTQNMASASPDDYQAAVSAALADGDNKDADIWLRYALASSPGDSQILILAARFEQARGDTARAIQYYRSSLKAMPPVSSGSKLASELGLPAPTAPLSLPSAAQPQDLSVLLSPGYIDTPQTGGQPYLPKGMHSAPLPPYDGTTKLVPPFMTNPDGTKNGSGTSIDARISVSPEVALAVHTACERAVRQLSEAVVAVKSQGSVAEEVYSPYVPYLVPTRAARVIGYQPEIQSVVAVQLGNATPHPVQAQVEVTDVLPKARYGPSARANQAAASHDQIVAARAERIRHLQQDSAAERSGQSHPPPEEIMAGVMQDAQYNHTQVARPSSPPPGYGAVPDSGAQQYPQPRTPPVPDRTIITRTRPVQHTPVASRPRAAAPDTSATQAIVPAAPAPVAPRTLPDEPQGPATTATTLPPRTSTQGFPAVGPEYPLPPPPADAELRAQSMPPLGGAYNSLMPNKLTDRQQVENELASLEGSYSGWLGVTGIGRYRSGTSGLDRLYDLESPVEASAVFGKKIRLTAVAEPVFLNSGTLNPADFLGPNVPYLGTMALNPENLPSQQFFNGVGGELQLAAKSFAMAVGYAPYESPVRNVTARFLWNGIGNHVSLFGDRQPVKDTLLSYVGLHDPGSASPLAQSAVWGGVIASTGGLRLQFGDTAASFFISGEGGVLTGRHVLNNYRFKGTIGAAFRVKDWANAGELRMGATLSGMHYQHDEIGLSYGQGGYFSPDTYFLGTVPISFKGHNGANFHYTIAGSVGLQTFQQNAALFYPLDPALQSSLVASQGAACTAALAATYACGEYPLIVRTQFNYTFNSEASYRFGDHWYGGGFVAADNSSNFNTVSAGFFFRFVFRAQHSKQGYPAGLFQVNGLRSLQIP